MVTIENQQESTSPYLAVLSRSEQHVLRELTRGKTNEQIAAKLHKSISTVKN